MGVFVGEKRAEFQKACEGKGVSEVSKMAGEEWKKLSEQDRKPYQKKYEAAKQQYDQDLATFLANGGAKEKGAAALRKDAMKLKESKKASKDKDAPKRPAGGAYGQFLAEKREEIKKSLPAGHSITDVTKKAGEMWQSLPADGRQKVDLPLQEATTPPKEAQKRKGDPTQQGQSKRGRQNKTSGKEGVEFSEEVLAKARAAGYEAQFQNLASRPEIIATGSSPETLLKALVTSGGLVNPAKQALLAGA